jgi:membrane associated rhomboid family serine protease
MFGKVRRGLTSAVRYELSAPVNLGIVVVTAAVFGAQKYLARNVEGVDTIWARLGYDRHLILTGREPWRLLTPNLIHTASWWHPGGQLAWIGTVGLLHVLAVCVALLAFGPLIEHVFGHRKYLVIYAVSGVAAYALLLIRVPAPDLQGGATGAVYGAFAAFLIVMLRRRREPGYSHLVRPAVAMFLILAIAQYGWNVAAPHLMHVGGFAAGIVLGLLFDPGERQAPTPPPPARTAAPEPTAPTPEQPQPYVSIFEERRPNQEP